jgi:transposase
MKLDDVGARAELSKGTIIAAVKAYRAGGWWAVKVGERGRSTGDGRTLDAEQEAALQRLICDKTPDQLKMGFALWSRGAVAALTEQQYGIRMPVRSVGHYWSTRNSPRMESMWPLAGQPLAGASCRKRGDSIENRQRRAVQSQSPRSGGN